MMDLITGLAAGTCVLVVGEVVLLAVAVVLLKAFFAVLADA